MQPQSHPRIELDIMKQYYSYEQSVFEREIDQLRHQITRGNVDRMKAEKELLMLQEQAKEKQIWNLLDQSVFMPNVVEGTRMFRTAKYAIGNMSQSERRQQLLLEYYNQDKVKMALQALYQNNGGDDQIVSELPSETHLLLPKEKKPEQQRPYQLDQSLLNALESMKQRDDEITRRLMNQDSRMVRDPEEFQTMLDNQSLLQIMQSRRQQGERGIITPVDIPNVQTIPKTHKSQGDSVQVTFTEYLQTDNQPLPSEIEFELADEVPQYTEEMLLNESEIPKITEQINEYEEPELSVDQSYDPIDDNIDNLLNNIKDIIGNKRTDDNFNTIQQKLRIATKQDYIIADKARPEYYKPIGFAKNQPIVVVQKQKEPIKLIMKQQSQLQQQQQQQQQDVQMDGDRLDNLIQRLMD